MGPWVSCPNSALCPQELSTQIKCTGNREQRLGPSLGGQSERSVLIPDRLVGEETNPETVSTQSQGSELSWVSAPGWGPRQGPLLLSCWASGSPHPSLAWTLHSALFPAPREPLPESCPPWLLLTSTLWCYPFVECSIWPARIPRNLCLLSRLPALPLITGPAALRKQKQQQHLFHPGMVHKGSQRLLCGRNWTAPLRSTEQPSLVIEYYTMFALVLHIQDLTFTSVTQFPSTQPYFCVPCPWQSWFPSN